MIQRIQSVWLFLATASIFSLFLFPYLQLISPTGTAMSLKVTGVYENINGQMVQTQEFLGLTIAAVILALIPFGIIFLYRDRKRQVIFSIAVIFLIVGFSFWLVQSAKAVIGDVALRSENYGIGVILPSIAILFVILAIRGIRRDDKLIRSADRLR